MPKARPDSAFVISHSFVLRHSDFFIFRLRLLAFATVAALEGRAPTSPTRATGVAKLRPPIPPNRKRVWCLILQERAIFHHPTKRNLHVSLRASSLIPHSSFELRHFSTLPPFAKPAARIVRARQFRTVRHFQFVPPKLRW